MLKFADDTKLFNYVSNAEDIARLTKDVLKHHWLMLFNVVGVLI